MINWNIEDDIWEDSSSRRIVSFTRKPFMICASFEIFLWSENLEYVSIQIQWFFMKYVIKKIFIRRSIHKEKSVSEPCDSKWSSISIILSPQKGGNRSLSKDFSIKSWIWWSFPCIWKTTDVLSSDHPIYDTLMMSSDHVRVFIIEKCN